MTKVRSQSDQVGMDVIRSWTKRMAGICRTDGSVLHQEVRETRVLFFFPSAYLTNPFRWLTAWHPSKS